MTIEDAEVLYGHIMDKRRVGGCVGCPSELTCLAAVVKAGIVLDLRDMARALDTKTPAPTQAAARA